MLGRDVVERLLAGYDLHYDLCLELRRVRSSCWHANLASCAFRHIVCGFTFKRQSRVQFWPATLVHAVELPYVFNNLEDDIYTGEVDPAVAAKAQESWVNFAKTGDPTISEAEWKPYDTNARYTMVIDKGGWECVSDPSKTARELLEKAYGDEPYHVW